jgi:hypothetical protein
MIDIFRKEIKISDTVKLYLTIGKEVVVDILEIGEKYILVQNSDGTKSRFFEQLIGGWDLINSKKEVFVENEIPKIEIPKKELPIKIIEPIIIDVDKTPSELDKTIIETENFVVKEESLENHLNERRIGLKIIGNIDLNQFEHKRNRKKIVIKPTEKQSSEIEYLKTEPSTLSEHIIQHNLVFKSFDNLHELKDKINLDNARKNVPANAVIKRFGQNSHGTKFGFLTDNEQNDYYFSISDIYDEKLKDIIYSNNNNFEGLQVICVLKSSHSRPRATSIYLPATIQEFLSLADNYYQNKEYIESQYILNFILNTVDDYEPALNIKNKIQFELRKNKITPENAASIFLSAKKELRKGNNDYAKKLLYELIETPNFKSETALKELSYELQREGNLDDAISLVFKNQNLIKTSDPNSLLAYFYETKKDYFTAISFLEKIKPKTSIERIRVDKRLAIDFFQINDYTSSEAYLKKVIEKQPNDSQSQKLLDALEKIKLEGISDEIETIFNEAELSSLSGGRSPLIKFALDNCDYAGVPASNISDEKFTKSTIGEIRRLIEKTAGLPKERAPYLLTEAKLIEKLEPEREDEFNSVMSKYCLAISQNIASENSPVDVVRFYLLEAFKLALSFQSITPFVPVYLYSFQLSSLESNKMNSKGIDETIKDIFQKELNLNFWNGLMDLFLTNTEIFSQLLTRLFQNKFYKQICISFLTNYNEVKQGSDYSKESFSELWNDALDKRRREKEAFNSTFNSIGKNKSIDSFTEAFNSVNKEISNWNSNLDKHRINSINDILRNLFEFNIQTAFEDRERYYNIGSSHISSIQLEIETSPTEFSFNILRHQLENLSNILENEFKLVTQTSKPIININILGESIILDNNVVTTSFNISNKKGCAPISWFILDINNSEGIDFFNENNENNQSLKGGEDKTLKLRIHVSNEIKEQGAFNLNVKFDYKIRGSEEVICINENLAVRLYSEDEFDEILNPFLASADSGPVQDEKMFYGRNEFIDNIKNSVLGSSSKCIIIYGQKRSGKSSVLFHLKKQLNQSTKAFCISFSLGEIVDDLSAQTFYYKILSEIEDSLDALPHENHQIPSFKSPSLLELKEAPSLIFNDYMKMFQKECAATPGWENKSFVLLIDEFTYIYTAIQKKFLSEQFMKTWKSFVEKSFFNSILIGQDIMPKFKMAYQNEFGIAEDKRLSYLSKTDAVKLIEEPIWDNKRNRSRFIGTATDLILDYTSSNPYYIQIFCARLVEYMNSQKAISVTEADVYEVAQTFIKGEQSLSIDKFDNLITAGDADIEIFEARDILKTLREIALASKNLDSCSRESINLGDKDKEDQILSDLKTREVISCPQTDYFKIKVRLFKEWLLNN